eukprot:2415104-Prymnesium_polylepis.1
MASRRACGRRSSCATTSNSSDEGRARDDFIRAVYEMNQAVYEMISSGPWRDDFIRAVYEMNQA